ncbi:MAG: hypothetical protein ACFFBD_13525, partial [Candidatus Hodarchaeota archaeon]
MHEILLVLIFCAFPVTGFICKFIDKIVDENYSIPNYFTLPVIFLGGLYSGGATILDDIVACVALALIIGLTFAKKVDDWRFVLLAVINLGTMFFGRLALDKPIIPSIALLLIPLLLVGVSLD